MAREYGPCHGCQSEYPGCDPKDCQAGAPVFAQVVGGCGTGTAPESMVVEKPCDVFCYELNQMRMERDKAIASREKWKAEINSVRESYERTLMNMSIARPDRNLVHRAVRLEHERDAYKVALDDIANTIGDGSRACLSTMRAIAEDVLAHYSKRDPNPYRTALEDIAAGRCTCPEDKDGYYECPLCDPLDYASHVLENTGIPKKV